MNTTPAGHFPNVSTPGSSGRKRLREHETPSQRQKREKAAERQRRKRERDRSAANTMGMMAYPAPGEQHHVHPPHHEALHSGAHTPQHPSQQASQPSTSQAVARNAAELTPQEEARRERVRAAARERQRKHRMLVKARKDRELGLAMGNDLMHDMGEYRVDPDGSYQSVMPHLQQAGVEGQEPPFPQGQPLGGQTFASTLLLAFNCTPLLKQHLLRSLSMTNDELASLEPVIGEAWDHWDHQVCIAHVLKLTRPDCIAPSVGCSNTTPRKLLKQVKVRKLTVVLPTTLKAPLP